MATSEAPAGSTQQSHVISATYQSPHSAPFTWAKESVSPPTNKTAYLKELREATTKLQDHINAELTARMEEDKLREAGSSTKGTAKAKGVIDEAREEDNYGEEVVEDD